jgi:hypothetical protein
VQACLDPLSTGFPPCATALGQFIESGICQPSQSSRRITAAPPPSSLSAHATTFCSSMAAAVPMAALSIEVKAMSGGAAAGG